LEWGWLGFWKLERRLVFQPILQHVHIRPCWGNILESVGIRVLQSRNDFQLLHALDILVRRWRCSRHGFDWAAPLRNRQPNRNSGGSAFQPSRRKLRWPIGDRLDGSCRSGDGRRSRFVDGRKPRWIREHQRWRRRRARWWTRPLRWVGIPGSRTHRIASVNGGFGRLCSTLMIGSDSRFYPGELVLRPTPVRVRPFVVDAAVVGAAQPQPTTGQAISRSAQC
jgi:hypothetical protein